MRLAFGEPLAALAALAGIVPITVALFRIGTARRVRRELRLPEPAWFTRLARPAALACLFVLLGLAAARPSLRIEHSRTARTDVQVMLALDSSRSMLAASAADQPARWQRAQAFARRLRAAIPSVPMGLSSLTNRLLPYLFPTSDRGAFDLVLDQSYGIQRPPPALTLDRWVTVFDPLSEAGLRGFFSPTVHKRLLVVLSDAEAHAFDAQGLRRRLNRSNTTPVVVRFWRPGERIFRTNSRSYRATQPNALTALRRAGWPAFSETQLGAAVRTIRATVGSGPLVEVGYRREDLKLAPFLALAAFVPLLVLVLPGGYVPSWRAIRSPQTKSGGNDRAAPPLVT